MLYAATRYQTQSFTFPEDILDPAKKTPQSEEGRDWARRTAEALFSLYVRDQTALLYSRRHDFGINRLYAEGNQPTTKYADQLVPGNTKDHQRKGWMNISWDILSVGPKFRAVVMGMFKKVDHDISATAIDEMAGAERESMKLAALVEAKLKPFLDQQGIDSPQTKLPFLPETEEEVGVLEEMGAFKVATEEAIEKVLNMAFYESDWEGIKEKLYEDLFDLGVAATIDYVDHEQQRVRCKYADPIDLIVKFSKDKKFENINEWGKIEHLQMSELRRQTQGQISPESLTKIAQQYCGYLGNPVGYNFDYYDFNYSSAGNQSYDDFKICVMELEWYSTDVLVHEKGTTKYGQKLFTRQGYDFKPKKKSKRVQTSIKTIYTCKWIVGSEVVYDFGKQHDIARASDQKKEPKFSLNIYKMGNKSMLASIIPLLDSIQITWLKIQNAIAKASPAGIAVEIGTLENMNIGGKDFSPLDILTIRRQTGDLLYRATTHHSKINSPNAGKPVTSLEGGVGSHLSELIGKMNNDIVLIREITGISSAIDASSAEERVAVGTQEMAAAGSSNVLHNMYMGYKWIKESTARHMALRFQVVSRYKEVKGYFDSVGRTTMEIIKIGSKKMMGVFGIKLELRPTSEMKNFVRQAALASQQRGEAGQGGITMDDYLEIEMILEKGNLKRARATLAYKDKIRKREAMQIVKANQMAQSEAQAMLEKAKTEETAKRVEMETKGKIAFDAAKKEHSIEIDNNKHKNKLIEMDKESANEHVVAARDHVLKEEQPEAEIPVPTKT